MDNQDAIQRLKRGDIGGLHVLVDRYQVRAARAAYLITQDTAMAEDIMQNAFLRVYDRIDQFDLTRPFEPWLMRIVINLALQTIGSQRRLVDLDALFCPIPLRTRLRKLKHTRRNKPCGKHWLCSRRNSGRSSCFATTWAIPKVRWPASLTNHWGPFAGGCMRLTDGCEVCWHI